MPPEVSVRELLESGSHFGHQVSVWNPKMRPYIFAAKNGVHILDLQQTVEQIKKACQFITNTAALGGNVLFVGTKRQAQAIVQTEAMRAGQFYVVTRWLGGMMTNFRTIKSSIDRLKSLQEKQQSEEFNKLIKKERLGIEREIEKLDRMFSGIKELPGLPSCLFIVDPHKEEIAVKEAKKLQIPIVAVVDTNCDPTDIDYIIAANDDAIRSIQLITKLAADACLEGSARRQVALGKEEGRDEGRSAGSSVTAAEDPSKKAAGEKTKAYVGGKKRKPGDPIEEIPAEDVAKFSRAEAGK